MKYYIIVIYLILAVTVSLIPIIQILDLKGLDLFWEAKNPHPNIIIVAIDNKSIQEIGRWPWTRIIYAEFLNLLKNNSIRTVAFDITFSEPENLLNDNLFAEAIKNSEFPIILSAEKDLLPIEVLKNNPNVKLGNVNMDLAKDGNIRNFPKDDSFSSVISKSLNYPLLKNSGLWINYTGPAGTFATFSFSDILNQKINPELLENKIVLIGATASNLHDIVPVPLENNIMAGIELHANILDNILLNRPIKILPEFITRLLGIILGLLLLIYIMGTNTIKSTLATITIIILLPLASYILWQNNIALLYFGNVIIIFSTFAVFSVARWYKAELEKRRLRERVQNYFSPNVMEAIIRDPSYLKLGGQRKEVSILFSDIRSFTTITEKTDPETLSRVLNMYFTEMTEEIFTTDGVLDKFIGDAIMAFWGAPLDQPDHADRAIKAAIGMMKRLDKLQVKLKEKNLPFIDIGIGINTGMATVGNLGSEKRFDYTVIGDSVNLASRIEGLNKEYKSHIIISENTAAKLPKSTNLKPLGEVVVKGKTVPIKIFEIIIQYGQ